MRGGPPRGDGGDEERDALVRAVHAARGRRGAEEDVARERGAEIEADGEGVPPLRPRGGWAGARAALLLGRGRRAPLPRRRVVARDFRAAAAVPRPRPLPRARGRGGAVARPFRARSRLAAHRETRAPRECGAERRREAENPPKDDDARSSAARDTPPHHPLRVAPPPDLDAFSASTAAARSADRGARLRSARTARGEPGGFPRLSPWRTTASATCWARRTAAGTCASAARTSSRAWAIASTRWTCT